MMGRIRRGMGWSLEARLAPVLGKRETAGIYIPHRVGREWRTRQTSILICFLIHGL